MRLGEMVIPYMLRPMSGDDYEALARFYVAAGQPTTAEGIRYNDEARPPHSLYGRCLAEIDGSIVGTGRFRQDAGVYHPKKFMVKVLVWPDFRNQGIGSALYDALWRLLQIHNPIALGTSVRETDLAGLRFAQRRGFVERMRMWESRLDLQGAQTDRFSAALDRVAAAGYLIFPFAERGNDPDFRRQVFALVNEGRQDVPSPDPKVDLPWEVWERSRRGPKFWPEGCFVAGQGAELVGVSELWRSDQPGLVQTGLTAVSRAHRARGIATALKVHAVRAAERAGYRWITTWNETNNHEMLAVNAKLGFVRHPALISLSLQIRPE